MDSSIITRHKKRILVISILVVCAMLACAFLTFGDSTITAIGKVDATAGAYLRSKATTSSKQVKILKNNAKVTIYREIFVSTKSTKNTNKWYYVSASGKKGYIRADLVDTIKYSAVKKKTTDALNYRVGPNKNMTRKGTFKKNTKISVVLPASIGEKGKTWYKVKKGTKYYYVDSSYTKAVSTSTSSSTKTSTTSTVTAKASDTTASTTTTTTTTTVKETPPREEGIGIKNLTYPESIGQYCSFTLKGTIESADIITKVRVGVLNSSGKWVIDQSAAPNSYTYDIAKIDAKIRFGSLDVGNYVYRIDVTAAGKTTTQVKKAFTVNEVKWPEAIGNEAIALCWPAGTSSATYAYPSGDSTAAYKEAMDKVFPKHNTWGKITRVGASCDIFVSTVCRACGYDTDMPTSRQAQAKHLASSDKWSLVNYNGKQSELRHGDIVIYRRSTGAGHVLVYVEQNGRGYLAEAAYKAKYPMLNTYIKKILSPAKNIVELKVYRAVS